MDGRDDSGLDQGEKITSLEWRIEDLENQIEAMKNLPWAVAQLSGMVVSLQEMVAAQVRGDRCELSAEDIPSQSKVKTTIHFLAVVIVPITVAAITGYFALKAAGK